MTTSGRPGPAGGGTSPAASWSHFPHDADVGLSATGPTREEAFRQAALALTAVVTDPSLVVPAEAVEVRCEAPSDELLLADWLNAIVYEMSVRSMLFGDYAVDIDGHRLRGTARGERVDPGRHEPAVEIKGVTMTALDVAPADGGWRVRCVVDV